MINEQLVAAIEVVLQEIRPSIKMHGGDIEFIKEQSGVVYVRLTGACIGCPVSAYTLKLGVEQTLKEKVPGITQVIQVEE